MSPCRPLQVAVALLEHLIPLQRHPDPWSKKMTVIWQWFKHRYRQESEKDACYLISSCRPQLEAVVVTVRGIRRLRTAEEAVVTIQVEVSKSMLTNNLINVRCFYSR